jgi:hypothetical protein
VNHTSLRPSPRRSLTVAFIMLALAVAARPAFAGPPLLCHPFAIGTAQSLTWNSTPGWQGDVASYNMSHLTDETLALLTPSTPVVVRMETLRRAAIYAMRDSNIADQLLTKLVDRTRKSSAGAKADGLAWFDAGYFIETARQTGYLTKPAGGNLSPLVANVDGYEMIQKSLMLRGDDPAIEFAAAIVTYDRHRDAHAAHVAKAREGMKQDALVAENFDKLLPESTSTK